jgi:hypothetical protein
MRVVCSYSRLRQKLGECGQCIETVVGVGYRFEGCQNKRRISIHPCRRRALISLLLNSVRAALLLPSLTIRAIAAAVVLAIAACALSEHFSSNRHEKFKTATMGRLDNGEKHDEVSCARLSV